jgi:fibronectin type 3 domain-containing protein
VGDGPFERLPDTQELPTYSDRKVESGKAYRYAVSAIKRNGFESPMSGPVEASPP